MRTTRSITLGAAGALLLSACSGGGESVDTGATGGGGGGGDVLVAAVSAQPDQFDPHVTSAYPSFQVLENVYDTLVVPKLDRLARSVPDARAIGDDLAARGIALSLGASVYDPTDPMGKMFFNILATFAEFEVDLLRMRTREGMAVARAKGESVRDVTVVVLDRPRHEPIVEEVRATGARIRLIPDGQALVIYRNSPAMIVDLIPWTKRPDGGEIAAGLKRVRAARIGQQS